MKPLTFESTVKELYNTPIGHDALAKVLLQLNLSEAVITNPFIGSLKLKTLASLTKGKLGNGFFEALLKKETSFQSGGKKLSFIRFIHEAFMIQMRMESEI